MRTAFKWICTVATIVIGTGAVGSGVTPEPISSAEPNIRADRHYAGAAPQAEAVEAAYASGYLPACAFAAILGCF